MVNPDKQRFVDRFGRRVTYLRISVTDRCNFRCVYCMPEEGIEHVPRPELLTYDEIVTIATVFARHGVRRIRLTGGEPLVRAELGLLIEKLKSIDGIERVAMTSNAFLLGRHVEALREAGLDSVNISLDSLDPETFEKMTRIGDLQRVLDGIDAAIDAGFEVKLNAVVVRGKNDHEVADLVEYAAQRGAIMRFIEFMPIGGDTDWGENACVPAQEIRDRLGERWEMIPDPSRYGTGPARYWRVHGPQTPSTGWPFGIISAVTECFCADCNRMRITPQGGLRACLADDREVNLRDALRLAPSPEQGNEAVEALIRESLFGKRETHDFDIDGDAVTDKRMHSIGG